MIYLIPPAGLHNFLIQKCYCVDALTQISDLTALPHLELDAYSGDMGIFSRPLKRRKGGRNTPSRAWLAHWNMTDGE